MSQFFDFNEVKNIGEYVFYQDKLENIDLTTVESIGKYAFSENMNLLDITIPVSVSVIDTHAFASSGATNVNLENARIFTLESSED